MCRKRCLCVVVRASAACTRGGWGFGAIRHVPRTNDSLEHAVQPATHGQRRSNRPVALISCALDCMTRLHPASSPPCLQGGHVWAGRGRLGRA